MRYQPLVYGLLAIAMFGLGGAVGYWQATVSAFRHSVIAEFKVHHLTLQDSSIQPQLREYLKSRVYFLAGSLRPKDLQGYDFDFGSVNESTLNGISGIKDCTTESDVYRNAMQTHRKNTQK